MAETRQVATIIRRTIMRSPLATGPGFAWKYIYDVSVASGELAHGVDYLASAERIARKHGYTPVRLWECGAQGGRR
jgi:hypothetical protein